MRCAYPNCYTDAFWIPVVALPTIRTAGESDGLVQTKRPTFLLFKEICPRHCNHYTLTDWMSEGDWGAIRDAAHDKGFSVPRPELLTVEFKPLGWTPQRGYLELERD